MPQQQASIRLRTKNSNTFSTVVLTECQKLETEVGGRFCCHSQITRWRVQLAKSSCSTSYHPSSDVCAWAHTAATCTQRRRAKNTVCVSQAAAWGSARGVESGGKPVRSHKTAKPLLTPRWSLLCSGKEKLNHSPVLGPPQIKRAFHQTRIRIRSSAWGTVKEMGFISRHWAHRDQTWAGWD